MNTINSKSKLLTIILIIIFFIGLYVTVYFDAPSEKKKEGLTTNISSSCPNMLVKKGNVLLLYNSNEPVGEKNPIPFFNLDEYINYLEIQKENGTDCPVLFLQHENDAQGKNVYRIRPSPFDLEGGLPTGTTLSQHDIDKLDSAVKVIDSTRNNLPYNENQYPGFDSHGQHVGEYTELDAIHESTGTKKISDNPMDTNWAGTTYTQQMVESGKYEGNEIKKPVYFNPKTKFLPSVPSEHPLPRDMI
jgi:hypothetical protein